MSLPPAKTSSPGARSEVALSAPARYPDNPVLCQVWRGDFVESQHRGAWVLVDGAGACVTGAGDFGAPVFARSAIKSMQALPLFDSGAAERFGLTADELALVVSSHNAETCHTEGVAALLERVGCAPADLRCGAQAPGDPAARRALAERGERPSALHNNCSGKHAGFLALARALRTAPARYLDPDDEPQRRVRRAVLETCGLDPDAAPAAAIDGCSAPTYRLPLAAQARGIARVATPDGLPSERAEACRRIVAAVAAHPVHLAGSHERLCTDLVRASGGRLFPKIGAEAVYLVGVVGADRGLAVKIDDGGQRALHAVVIGLLERLELLDAAAVSALERWRGRALANWAGLVVSRLEVVA